MEKTSSHSKVFFPLIAKIQVKLKALPNVNNAVEIERPELEIDLIDQGTESDVPFDVTHLEDGGVELDFEPGMKKIPGTENHFDNLADLLPDDI